MGRRDISQRYIRLTGWVWIAVFACAAFAALFAVLVRTNPDEGIKAGEILQAVASLAGSALGILGAFMLARWSLSEAERDRRAHRHDLAFLTMNTIVDLISRYAAWSMAFEKLDVTNKAIIEFMNHKNQYDDGKINASPGLRDELVASFPRLEINLDALIANHDIFNKNCRYLLLLAQANASATELAPAFQDFLKPLSYATGGIAAILLFYETTAGLADVEQSFREEARAIAAFASAGRKLAERTAPDLKLDWS